MGWASGSSVLRNVWNQVREYIDTEKDKEDCLRELVKVFESSDCDTCDEIQCEKWPETLKIFRE
jgi:hypothetical protein